MDTIIRRYYLLKLVEETKLHLHLSVLRKPSSNEIEKLEWLRNSENLLADVYLKWNDVFIVTGDFNIDLPIFLI